MSLLSDSFQKEKLDKFNINIKTKYIVDGKILERNTDDSHNDDIVNGIRCEKDYYINNKIVHNENLFDSRIEYTYMSKSKENEEYECKNCGYKSQLKDFYDSCPYCGTKYNIDYTDKDLGSKYHYDMVLRKTTYKITTAIIDFCISLALSYIFIKFTSRTFNTYDISKIFIYGAILSLILYYFFYIIDAYVVLSPIKKYKNKQNKKQIEFWNTTKIDKKSFFNNLNYEVRKKYYSEDSVIDYDILDYTEFSYIKSQKGIFVRDKADVRIIYFKNKKIKVKFINDIYTFKQNDKETINLKSGANLIKCHNCGATVDVKNGYCEYCNSKIKFLQEWVII